MIVRWHRSTVATDKLKSMCCRGGCPKPWITYEEWCRNDGACDPCAELRPSQYFTSMSHDESEMVKLRNADRRWRYSMPEGSAKCRSCQAPIFWAKSKKGKLMPMDSEPVETGHFLITDRHGDHPLATFVKDTSAAQPETKFYVSHYATCRDAGDWRGTSAKA